MKELKVRRLIFQYENQLKKRRIKCILTNGHMVMITRCYESYDQWGGTPEDLAVSTKVAEKYNDWLHGKK